jgi:hypothetical protein
MPNVTPTSTVQDAGLVARLQPTPSADGLNAPIRQDKFGAIAPWCDAPTRHQFAEEGSYILATNPTISTGLTWVAAQTAFSDTAPNFYIFNNSLTRSLYLDYLKMIATAAATTAASIQYAIKTQSVARTFTTNNMLTIVPVNPNQALPLLENPVIMAQNSASVSVMTASDSSARIVGRGNLGGLNIAGTEMLLTFGSTDAGCYPGSADAANQPGRRGASCPPIIIGPSQALTVYIWMPGSAASFNPEFELGMWAR